MTAVARRLLRIFKDNARYRRSRQPRVVVTITIGDRPVFIGPWPDEVPFDG